MKVRLSLIPKISFGFCYRHLKCRLFLTNVFSDVLVNSIAAAIWHRVRLKLQGRDPNPIKQLTVEEQVNFETMK